MSSPSTRTTGYYEDLSEDQRDVFTSLEYVLHTTYGYNPDDLGKMSLGTLQQLLKVSQAQGKMTAQTKRENIYDDEQEADRVLSSLVGKLTAPKDQDLPSIGELVSLKYIKQNYFLYLRHLSNSASERSLARTKPAMAKLLKNMSVCYQKLLDKTESKPYNKRGQYRRAARKM